jgi:hypothetical protein
MYSYAYENKGPYDYEDSSLPMMRYCDCCDKNRPLNKFSEFSFEFEKHRCLDCTPNMGRLGNRYLTEWFGFDLEETCERSQQIFRRILL